jgi:hypothetical protein
MRKKTETRWSKLDSIKIRRINALSSHHKDFLLTARSMQYLANISGDDETRRKARSDSKYFFAMYKRMKKHV